MKKLSLVLALLLTLSCFAFASAETEAATEATTYETAREIYQTGDYAAALPLFEELAAAGDAMAAGYLGDYYAKGLLGEVDFAKAAELYMKAAAGGDVFSAATLLSHHNKNEIPAEAIDFIVVRDTLLAKQETYTGEDENDAIYLFWIGHSYEKGLFSEDGAPDYVNGYTYYFRAAELGQTHAMHDIAGSCLNGNYTEGVPDPEKALEWYQKAYEGSHACATTHIFGIYKDGVTAEDGTVLIAPDEEKAYAYLEQVFAEGRLDNYNGMRDKLISHLEAAETPDYAHILEIWEDAADKGDASAAVKAAQFFKDGVTAEDGTVLIAPDHARAFAAFEKAYAAGSTDLYVLEWLGHYVAGAYEVQTPDDPRAAEIFEQAAAIGSTFAAERLSEYYCSGKTAEDGTVLIAKDLAKALPHLETTYAAGSTNTYLLSMLGYILRGNEDIMPADHLRALEVFTRAADLGDLYASERVATYYCSGKTAEDGAVLIAKDLTKALPYLETAYAAGTADTYLLSMLGYILSTDEVVPADPLRAMEVHTKSAGLGDRYSCEYVGKAYLSDTVAEDGTILIAKDHAKALEYLRKAYENGCTEAYVLSWLGYFATTGIVMEEDHVFAAEVYTLLSDQGDIDASGHLAYYYLTGVTAEDGSVVIEVDHAKALPYLQICIEAGTTDTYLLSMMGYFLAGNDGLMEADYARAVEVFQQGADLGDGYCWSQLGAIYQNGQLGEADAAKAAECYRKAVELGYTDAQAALDDMQAE